MGTWDEGSFGNDTACDWSYGLEKVNDLRYVETTLDKVLAYGAGEMVPADAAECAVAAAEVIARLKGRWGEEDSYTETTRSEEHTSELQSPCNLVCRLLLEKKKSCQTEPRASAPDPRDAHARRDHADH